MIKYFKMHLKTKLEYKVSFILTLISQLFVLLSALFVIYSLFTKFGSLKQFSINECLLSFGIVQLGFYTAEFIFRGFDNFSKLVKYGKLDILLLRPENIFLQILGSDIGLTKITRVLGSVFILIYALIKCNIDITVFNVFILILTLIGSLMLYGSIYILGATLSFYIIEGMEIINILTCGSREIGQFPMGIYSKKVLMFFTFIIPLSCVNYYPVMYILGKSNNLLYAISPVLSIIIIIPSILIFNHGLKKYKSCG